jgi:multiple sugar transport system substrate-binding protein
MSKIEGTIRRRRLLTTTAAGIAAGAGLLRAPAVIGQTKGPYAGTTIRGSAFSLPFHGFLRNYFPEFEEKTGIKIIFDVQAFPIYNQRTDLELSTHGSTYDVINVTYAYTGRWIGAGWMTDLDQFSSDPNRTPPEWDPADFIPGAQSAMRDAKGHTYGFGIEAGAMILGAARGDLIEKAGLKLPTTLDEFLNVCEMTNGKDGVGAYVADKLHHWNWVPYLLAVGGSVMKNAPTNMTPTLDTPIAAKSAQWYADLLTKYSVPGVLSYTDDQAMQAQLAGRASIRTQSMTWMLPLFKSADSTVKNTVRYGMMPGGPAGVFPGANCHAFGIPAGSRKKEAAWEFIKWALSKEMLTRIVEKYGYPSVCRRSVVDTSVYREAMTLNGQDCAALYLKVLERGAQGNYMAYRTTPVFPQVGDKMNRAIEAIATGQSDAATALKLAQAQAVEDIKKSGISIDG